MKRKPKLTSIKSLDEIPEHMSEAEAAEFFSTHSFERVFDQMEPVEEEFAFKPPAPQRRLSVSLRGDMIDQLKQIAAAKGWPLRTLIWLWLHQRLQEEEAKRALEGKPDRSFRKQDMLKALEQLPDDATVEDGLDCLRLLQKIEYGMAQADAGQTVSQEEAKRRMDLLLRNADKSGA